MELAVSIIKSQPFHYFWLQNFLAVTLLSLNYILSEKVISFPLLEDTSVLRCFAEWSLHLQPGQAPAEVRGVFTNFTGYWVRPLNTKQQVQIDHATFCKLLARTKCSSNCTKSAVPSASPKALHDSSFHSKSQQLTFILVPHRTKDKYGTFTPILGTLMSTDEH